MTHVRIRSSLAGLPLLVCLTSLLTANPQALKAQHEQHVGNGDDVLQINKPNPDMPALLAIQGNPQGRHFSVIGYTSNRERTGLLVNTTDPYQGIVPVDLPPQAKTSLLEISATGSWSIDVYPIGAAHKINVPESYQGNGDDVLWVDGDASTAEIRGNSEGRHFSVNTYDRYGNRSGLLVNTTSPYEGTVMVPRDVLLLQISADGRWTVQLER